MSEDADVDDQRSSATSEEPGTDQGMSRRRLFGLAGGTAGVLAAGGIGAWIGAANAADDPGRGPGGGPPDSVDFHGEHQAGVVTPAQDRLHFVSFDIITDDRDKVIDLLARWTDAARRMSRGDAAGPGGAIPDNLQVPPQDTGEALGLPASNLTITVGFGPGLFVRPDGSDRFGFAAAKPEALQELPVLTGDQLRPEISGGDLCIQACANDPQVAVHAVRNLARIGFGVVSVRWSQLGFGRTSSTSVGQETPRNLFGFKDGTNNLKAENTEVLDERVWVQPGDGPDWLVGGSYLVSRRIRMTIETWDRQPLVEQENVIGRAKGSGAPLGTAEEFDPVDLAATLPGGESTVPENSHIRLANPNSVDGAAILRRGYSFVDGTDGLGRLDAGLFFICYQRDPATGFIAVQNNLRTDLMNEYIRHTSSAIFACPPGLSGPDDVWGAALLG